MCVLSHVIQVFIVINFRVVATPSWNHFEYSLLTKRWNGSRCFLIDFCLKVQTSWWGASKIPLPSPSPAGECLHNPVVVVHLELAHPVHFCSSTDWLRSIHGVENRVDWTHATLTLRVRIFSLQKKYQYTATLRNEVYHAYWCQILFKKPDCELLEIRP